MPSIEKLKILYEGIRKAARGYEKAFVLTTIAGMLGGILGGIGISALIPLFAYLTGIGATGGSAVTAFIYRIFDTMHVAPNATYLLSFIALLFVAKAFVLFSASRYGEKMSIDYGAGTRKVIFKGLLGSSWRYLLEQKTGHLERVIMDDASKAGQILHDASSLVFTAGSLFIYLAVAFTISAEVTLITILPAAAILLFSKSIYAQVRRYADSLIATEKEVAHHINEHLGGAKAIKSLAAEEGATKGAFARIEKITGLEMRMVFYKLLSASFFEPMSLILIAFVFLYSYQRPGFDFGSFVVAIYLIQKIFGYLQTMQAKFQNINRYIPSLQTVLRYRELVSAHAEPNPGNRTFAFNNALRFENASFGYGDKAPTLSGVSFTVNKGEEVGIIGPSGSGKTTIADLLLRLFNPTSGMITMDGKDIAEIRLDEWRKNVGYVSQDVFLLNDTIENNIRFYDEGVGRDAVVEAARLANILDAVERFPKGLETIVGERGVKLSGGERQRIALARVLARKPSVLILDEATSALDNESELLIQKTLESLRGKTTVITIAHRISTIQNADSVIALDQGKVLEQGSPQDLLKDEDSYFKKMRLMSSK